MLPLKRGRPKKRVKSEFIRITQVFQNPLNLEKQSYEAKYSKYLKNHYNQKLRTMIIKVIKELKLSSMQSAKPILNIFEITVKELLISEIELLSFSIIFSQTSFPQEIGSIEEQVKLCFFTVKTLIETDSSLLNYFYETMKNKIRNFEEKAKLLKPLPSLTTKEILKKYQMLSKFNEFPINYSYYVDDILRTSPPYKISKKVFKITKRLKVTEQPQNSLVSNNSENTFRSGDKWVFGNGWARNRSSIELYRLIPIGKLDNEFVNEQNSGHLDSIAQSDSLCSMSPRLDESSEDIIII